MGHVSCSSSPLDFNWTVRKQVKRFQNLPPPSVESSLLATRKLDVPDQSTRHLVPARPQMPDRAWSWPKKGCLPSPPAYTAPSARSTVQRMRRRTGGAATPALRTSPAPSHSAEYNCQRPCRQSGHWKMTSSCSTKCLKVKLLTGPTLDTDILCLGTRWLQHPQPCLTRVR